MAASPVDAWHALLSASEDAGLCDTLAARMRAARLRFGDRVLCPFLRPFFLDAADEVRVTRVAETLWTLGERVARVALETHDILGQLALSEEEIRLARIDPGYLTASTAARADAFILPDSLQFAEYNGESPAGAGYSEGLAELFAALPLADRFREQFGVRIYHPVRALLQALVDSFREWGGTTTAPRTAIVDWREVPTFSEFEILRDAFTQAGVPTIVCDPRDLAFEGGRLRCGEHAIDLVYRRVLINDMIARPAECRALVDAYEQRAVCVANTLRCKIPHKKAFFAVLTDDRHSHLFTATERDVIRQHIPWTALVEDGRVSRDGRRIDLVSYLRANRDRFVIKPNDEYGGTGVTLGWEASESQWDETIARAIAERARGWVAQERIAVRREAFPICDPSGVVMRDMLVDFAPYIFRGKLAGFLTRLSATGLANVTSGGGQVPAFVVSTTPHVQ
jgi:uncharacterized circularly permuted ATP-grasp superfamily protein